jgi:hypothetical protein
MARHSISDFRFTPLIYSQLNWFNQKLKRDFAEVICEAYFKGRV